MDCAIVVHLQQSMEEGLLVNCTFFSKHPDLSMEEEEGKDQESKQSNTIRELGHHMGKLQKHKKTSHTREQRGQSFPSK